MVGMNSGRQAFFSSFLSRFDAPLGQLVLQISSATRNGFIVAWQRAGLFLHSSQLISTVALHRLVQGVERRVRSWREFARERKIERKPATSAFIKDVAAYKEELKQNHTHE